MTTSDKVFLRRFNPQSKYEPLVEEVQLLETNPTHARVRYPDGRECGISLTDVSPCPTEETVEENLNNRSTNFDSCLMPTGTDSVSTNIAPRVSEEIIDKDASYTVRRSNRINKGVPPSRYGIDL